ncbi:MAG: recombinase family protein [Pirellulaceae bacterium]|jgi:site-specific DNA recombinase
MKAVFYVRCSTDAQATEGVSLEAQLTKLQAWAEFNSAEVVATFEDAGISGTRDDRPGLAAAIEAACRNKAALVVYSLSRLSRSTSHTIAVAERLEKAQAELVSITEKIDTTTAAGKMVFRMLATLAEFERDQIAERTKNALRHKKAKGERVGTVPYGWNLAADGVALTINETEQRALEIIKRLRSSGLSLQRIATELEALGILTKKGKVQWTHTAVKSILERNAA